MKQHVIDYHEGKDERTLGDLMKKYEKLSVDDIKALGDDRQEALEWFYAVRGL